MKDSLFLETKLVFLESGDKDPDSWGNPYDKGNRLERKANLIENDPRYAKLNEMGKQLSRYTDTMPINNKPVELKSVVDGEATVRKLLIKKENALVRVSIIEKKSDNFFIKNDFYFDHTTGKYIKGLTSIRFDEDIRTNKDSNPFTLLNILPPIIGSKPIMINKAEKILNTKLYKKINKN